MDIIQQKLQEIDAEMAQLQTVKDALLRAAGKTSNAAIPTTPTTPSAPVSRVARGRRGKHIVRTKNAAPAHVAIPLPVTHNEDTAIPSPALAELLEAANKE